MFGIAAIPALIQLCSEFYSFPQSNTSHAITCVLIGPPQSYHFCQKAHVNWLSKAGPSKLQLRLPRFMERAYQKPSFSPSFRKSNKVSRSRKPVHTESYSSHTTVNLSSSVSKFVFFLKVGSRYRISMLPRLFSSMCSTSRTTIVGIQLCHVLCSHHFTYGWFPKQFVVDILLYRGVSYQLHFHIYRFDYH